MSSSTSTIAIACKTPRVTDCVQVCVSLDSLHATLTSTANQILDPLGAERSAIAHGPQARLNAPVLNDSLKTCDAI